MACWISWCINYALRQSTAKTKATLWYWASFLHCWAYKSRLDMRWTRNMSFILFSFLNIVHLLHTKETHGTRQISNIGFYDYKPFPSHNFYNKYTSTLGIGLFLDHSWWDIQVDLECPCLTSGKNRFMLHFCKIYTYIMMASAFCMNTVKGICFFENTFLNIFGLFYRSLHTPFQVQFLLIHLPMISVHTKRKKT